MRTTTPVPQSSHAGWVKAQPTPIAFSNRTEDDGLRRSTRLTHPTKPKLETASARLLFEPREHLQRVLLEYFRFIFRREPRDGFNIRPHVVVPLAGARIGL